MSTDTASVSSADTAAWLPGRLGSPDITIGNDRRADPRMVAALEPLDLHLRPDPVPVSADGDIEAILGFWEETEPGFDELFEALYQPLAPVEGVEHEEVTPHRGRRQ